jgi:hypothetical protein
MLGKICWGRESHVAKILARPTCTRPSQCHTGGGPELSVSKTNIVFYSQKKHMLTFFNLENIKEILISGNPSPSQQRGLLLNFHPGAFSF